MAFDITGLASSSVSFDETVKLKCVFDSASGQLTMTQDGTPISNHNTAPPSASDAVTGRSRTMIELTFSDGKTFSNAEKSFPKRRTDFCSCVDLRNR